MIAFVTSFQQESDDKETKRVVRPNQSTAMSRTLEDRFH